jgi:hypothetical protein
MHPSIVARAEAVMARPSVDPEAREVIGHLLEALHAMTVFRDEAEALVRGPDGTTQASRDLAVAHTLKKERAEGRRAEAAWVDANWGRRKGEGSDDGKA